MTPRCALGVLLGLLVRCWVGTLRIRCVDLGGSGRAGPSIFAFWHGQQMLLAGVQRPRPTVTLVSWSRDGSLQSGVLRVLGMSTVRGSGNRGGAEGLRRVVAAVQAGASAAFAVDGSRGPLHRAKGGAMHVALHSGAALVPVGASAQSAWILGKTWDQFEIPRPFSRVVVVLGCPLPAKASREELSRAIDAAGARARVLIENRHAL